MGRPLKPTGRKARDQLAGMDVDLALAAKKQRQAGRIMYGNVNITDPVKRNERLSAALILMSEVVDLIDAAHLGQRNVVEIYDAYDRLNNGDGP